MIRNDKNEKEIIKKNLEKYHTDNYFYGIYKKHPTFYNTKIHPDCLVKINNTKYAVEATGYFYQQETDYSNRLYKKVDKLLNDERILESIYNNIGKNSLINVIDSIYYNDIEDMFLDILIDNKYIDELKVNDDIYYNESGYGIINNKKVTGKLKDFLKKIDMSLEYYHIEITLKKKYLVPIKVIFVYDKLVTEERKRILVPIVSFNKNNNYNFMSLRSLIINKEQKLKNIYLEELEKNKVSYDKFVLLIHPIDYLLDIEPRILYSKLSGLFKNTKYDEIGILLKNYVMVITREGYRLFK